MHEVIRYVVDDGEFLEIFPLWAMQNVVIGFARDFDGRSIVVIANQPKVNAGNARHRGERERPRFVRFCDAFNIPILNTAGRRARSCPARTRSTTASSATVPSCSTPTPRPPCRE